MRSHKSSSSSKKGFTLTELLLAMLVFAIAITTILALLARSIETVDEVLLKDEAMRLSGAVEDFHENQSFNASYTGFNGMSAGTLQLLAFNYRGIPDQAANSDGSLQPFAALNGVVNEDFVLTPFVGYNGLNPTATGILTSNLTGLEGRLFLVRLSVSPNNPVAQPLPANPDTYASAVLVLYAEYFPVSALDNLDVDALGISPAYSYTFAIRR